MRMTKDGEYLDVKGDVAISAFKNSGWIIDNVKPVDEKKEEVAETPATEEETQKRTKRTKK